MRIFGQASMVVLTLLQGCDSSSVKSQVKLVSSKVINGALIAKENPAAKFTVFIENLRGSYCSGSLIAPNVVLTAAHCLRSTTPEQLKIKMGVQADRLQAVNWITVKTIFMHEEWDNEKDQNDIALIELERVVDSEYRPIAIFDGPLPVGFGKFALEVYGYSGYTHNSSLDMSEMVKGHKRESRHSYNSIQFTHDLFGKLLPASENPYTDYGINFLFVDQLAGGMCQGDSGGPMVVNINGEKVQIAINDSIVHFGDKNGVDCSSYSAATRVAPYLPWINEKLASINLSSIATKQFDTPEAIAAENDDTYCIYSQGNVTNFLNEARENIVNNVCDIKLISNLEEYVGYVENYCTTDLSRGYLDALKATLKSVEANCDV